jgi:hypothetical protein
MRVTFPPMDAPGMSSATEVRTLILDYTNVIFLSFSFQHLSKPAIPLSILGYYHFECIDTLSAQYSWSFSLHVETDLLCRS